MRRHRIGRSSTTKEIDISPLIDMVFILLIFFMVTTTFVKDMKVELERPGAASATRASSKSLRVAIDSGGNIYVDGTQVRSWMVQSRVRDFLQGATAKSVLVITDRRVPAERLVEVVDQCRLAGASDIGVATEKEAG
jgi:biopolymer transport protein ExbD